MSSDITSMDRWPKTRPDAWSRLTTAALVAAGGKQQEMQQILDRLWNNSNLSIDCIMDLHRAFTIIIPQW